MPPAHVLIVEDDPTTALVLSEYLASYGFKTTVAVTGTEGIARCLADPPDLALVDVLLPRRDGFGVCFAIKSSEQGKSTRVVLMSAVYRNLAEAETYSRGARARRHQRRDGCRRDARSDLGDG